MRVSHLALTDFRSYESSVTQFPAGVSILQGQNGRGKTNLVEAIAFMSTFSSHRVASSASLVRVAKPGLDAPGGAVIRTRVETNDRSTLVELEIAKGRPNRARVNRANVAPRFAMGILRSVVFAPEDLNLLKGDPSERRRFIDEVVTKLRPPFAGVLQDFSRVSRQRAAQLKAIGPYGQDDGSLQVWDEQMATLSAKIAVYRLATVAAMRPLIEKAYESLTEGDRIADLSYVSHLQNEIDLEGFGIEHGQFVGDPTEQIAQLELLYRSTMTERRRQELARGINLVGAHRDDLLITLDGLPVRGFASHGETWSAALMLRLAELELLKQYEDYPVLILDDVFAELDDRRRSGLLERINAVEQVFVTVASEQDLPAELIGERYRVFRDDEGLSHIEKLTQEVAE